MPTLSENKIDKKPKQNITNVRFSDFPIPNLITFQFSKLGIFLRIARKSIVAFICLFSVCSLIFLEFCQIQQFLPISDYDELRQVEMNESVLWIGTATTLVWTISVYVLVNEMMLILSGNEQIRVLEALRHRTRMELIVALTVQKEYNDAHGIQFVVRNNGNQFVEAVDDEMDANEMMFNRVHGLNRRF